MRTPGRKKLYTEEQLLERRKGQVLASKRKQYRRLRDAGFSVAIAKTRNMKLLATTRSWGDVYKNLCAPIEKQSDHA